MDLLTAIADERRTIADMLETLTDEQWSTPSLAEGWTVRNVTAHLVMPFRYSLPKVMWEVAKARGNFNKVADNIAKRDASLPTAELIDTLRRKADHKFKPPGQGFEAPLTDAVVHGLDIRLPLGIDRTVPADRWRTILDYVIQPKVQKFFKTDLSGVTLSATDLGWSSGSGPTVSGSADDIGLVMTGRRSALDRLSGDGVALLSSRKR